MTVRELLETLDGRGIIMSIASKNDPVPAEKKLRELGLWEYFLVPAISWGQKSEGVSSVISALGIKFRGECGRLTSFMSFFATAR